MKTKVKLFGAVAVFAIALGVNASIGMTNDSGDVALSDLVNASEANAECMSTSFNNCSCGLSNVCFWGRGDASDYKCDTTRG